ncbi:unnamed protein product [Symbiodinium natans]|uniref:Uncharacterized protein n=1 Tax=Symbiodinium natans TaxID=878477 RepID=A0A812NZ89_9DINO|nr:unnamed protein product [Symbiodinium natans]
MAEGGGVFPRKREGKVAHWHVRFIGTGLQDFVVSVDKEERELAETLLAILRSLDPADHGDNAKLRRISQEKLKHLRQEVHSRPEPNAGPGGHDEAAPGSSSSSSDGTSSQLRAAAAAAAAAGRERRKSREVKKKKKKKKEKKEKKHKKGKREKLPKDGKQGKDSDTKPVAASPAGASLQIQVECEVCCEVRPYLLPDVRNLAKQPAFLKDL